MVTRMTTTIALSLIASGAAAMILFQGRRQIITAFSTLANNSMPGRLIVGQPAGRLFTEPDARLALASLRTCYDTADIIRTRQRLWNFVPYMSANRPEIDVTYQPVFESETSDKVVGVLAEAKYAHQGAGMDFEGERIRNTGVPGGMAFYEAMALGFEPEAALGLVQIRQAARDAMIEACSPLVEELRRRRGGQATLGSHREYRPPRPV